MNLSAQVRAATLDLLTSSGTTARLAMTGESMLPLLHAPMVLEIAPVGEDPRSGEVLVFQRGDRLVAHRLLWRDGTHYFMAGDNRPHEVDRVPHADAVGRVVAVWSRDGDGAVRVDTVAHRIAGAYMVRTRRARAAGRAGKSVARSVARAANPRKRTRAVGAIVRALKAIARSDREAFLRAIAAVDAAALCDAARKHRISGVFFAAIGDFDCAGDERAARLMDDVRAFAAGTAVRTAALRTQIGAVVQALNEAGVPHALLKGAARIYARDDGGAVHPSADLDVLVPRQRVGDAARALEGVGYRYYCDADEMARYRRDHHHLAPMIPPQRGCPVELHVALAPPGRVSTQTEWQALSEHTIEIAGEAGSTRRLNRVAGAFHLAIHNLYPLSLRDLFLLAELLGRMPAQERAELARWIEAERYESTRIGGVVTAAAAIAGVEWRANKAARRYARWLVRREDLPATIAARSQVAEVLQTLGTMPPGHAWAVAWAQTHGFRDTPRRAGRIIAGLCAVAYARLLPEG